MSPTAPRRLLLFLLIAPAGCDLWSAPADTAARPASDTAAPEPALPPPGSLTAPAEATAVAPTGGPVQPRVIGTPLHQVPPPLDEPVAALTRADAVPPAALDTDVDAYPMIAGTTVRTEGERSEIIRFILVNDEAQTWEARASGVRRLSLRAAGAPPLVRSSEDAGTGLHRLSAHLLPGTYHLEADAAGGEVLLRATALGTPDGLSEREPNDDRSRALRLPFGVAATGAFRTHRDQDVYRLNVPHPTFARVVFAPPAGEPGRLELKESLTNTRFARVDGSTAGGPLIWEGWLPEGAYLLTVRSKDGTVSEARYSVGVERLDPFLTPDDLEPNDDASWGRELPVHGWARGETGPSDPRDAWVLPEIEAPTPILVTMRGVDDPGAVRSRVVLYEADGRTTIKQVQLDAEAGGLRVSLPPGPGPVLVVRGVGTYAVQVQGLPGTQERPPPTAIGLGVPSAPIEVAAYHRHDQQIVVPVRIANPLTEPVDIDFDAHASHPGVRVELPSTQPLPAGTQTILEIPVRLEADLDDHDEIVLTLAASVDGGLPSTGHVRIRPVCGAPPVNPVASAPVGALAGGLNVAAAAHGGRIEGEGRRLEELIDGLVPNTGGAVLELPAELRFDLAGDSPVALSGLILTGKTKVGPPLRALPFVLSVSTDGERYTDVLAGTLDATIREQVFPLDKPVSATHARLSFPQQPALSRMSPLRLGEVKLVAAPGAAPTGGRPDIAEPALGGNIVSISPHVRRSADMLSEGPTFPRVRVDATVPVTWVVGFHHTRVARIQRLTWRTAGPDAGNDRRMSQVEVAISTDGAAGPWQPLGAWSVDPEPGAVTTWDLEAPTWARFVRFRSVEAAERTQLVLPDKIGILEGPQSDGYTTILGEYGGYSPTSTYEHLVALAPTEAGIDAGDDADSATPLPLGTPWRDAVSVGEDEDWFALTVPDGHNTLELRATGEPRFGGRLELRTTGGEPLHSVQPSPGILRAEVEPGTVLARVSEPPRNIAIAWDNSGSVSPYYGTIYQVIDAFAAGVQPGRETANLLPFQSHGGEFLLDDWTDDPDTLRRGIAEYDRSDGSSDAEVALWRATVDLHRREGTAAILLLTDAETHSSHKNGELWAMWERLRPRVFTVELHRGDAATHQDLMQGWASADAGHYAWFSTPGDIETAFQRASCHLRRPVPYTLVAQTRHEEPPPPGSVHVVAASPQATGGIEIILDASGSMLMAEGDALRWQIARDALTDLVERSIPAGTPVALRAFGHRQPRSCETWLEVPPKPLDPQEMSSRIAAIRPKGQARTPLGASLEAVQSDMASIEGEKRVVLLTDGDETCGGDPAGAIEALKASGVEVRVNIVGFGITEESVKADFERWASLGGGRWFDAQDSDELASALTEALQPKVELLGAGGDVIATGAVGDPVQAPPGTYVVRVLTTPPVRFADVQVRSGEQTRLEVGGD